MFQLYYPVMIKIRNIAKNKKEKGEKIKIYVFSKIFSSK